MGVLSVVKIELVTLCSGLCKRLSAHWLGSHHLNTCYMKYTQCAEFNKNRFWKSSDFLCVATYLRLHYITLPINI